MFKTITKLVVWSLLATLPACAALTKQQTLQTNTTTMAERLEDKTVAMVTVAPEDDEESGTKKGDIDAYCTGVWVSQTEFLTADHCVEDLNKSLTEQLMEEMEPERAKAWNPVGQVAMYSVHSDLVDGKTIKVAHKAVVKAVDKQHDLALVMTTDTMSSHPVAVLREGKIHDGEDLNIVGQTMGQYWTYVHGYVSATRIDAEGAHGKHFNVLQVSSPAYFGNSGGGAFDEEGSLVGIMSYVTTASPEMGFFIAPDHIGPFLRANKKG